MPSSGFAKSILSKPGAASVVVSISSSVASYFMTCPRECPDYLAVESVPFQIERCGQAERSRTLVPPQHRFNKAPQRRCNMETKKWARWAHCYLKSLNGCLDAFNSPSGCELFTLGVISPNRVVCRPRRGYLHSLLQRS